MKMNKKNLIRRLNGWGLSFLLPMIFIWKFFGSIYANFYAAGWMGGLIYEGVCNYKELDYVLYNFKDKIEKMLEENFFCIPKKEMEDHLKAIRDKKITPPAS